MGDDDGREPDDRAADAPPSRFGEVGPLLPPAAVDRRGPAAGLSREVMMWSGDGGDRRIKGLVGDRRIGEEDRPLPSSGGKLKLRLLIGDDFAVNDDDGGDGGNGGDDDKEDGGDDNNDSGDNDAGRRRGMGRVNDTCRSQDRELGVR